MDAKCSMIVFENSSLNYPLTLKAIMPFEIEAKK